MLILFVLLGLSGVFGSQLLYILGVYWVGPDIASAFQPIIPVWTAILAILTCVEKVPSPLHLHSWVKFGGILLATGGAIELVLTGIDNPSNRTRTDCNVTNSPGSCTTGTAHSLQVLGYITLISNTLLTAIYVLLQKRFIFNSPGCKFKQYPVTITAYSYFFGAIFMGLSTIYPAVTSQGNAFRIPTSVSQERCDNCMCLLHNHP